MPEMVNLKLRVPREMAAEFAIIAAEHERSVMAEHRVAIAAHIRKYRLPPKKE